MKLIGQQKSLFKLAAVLFATNIFGVGSSLACGSGSNPPSVYEIGCGVDAAVAYAVKMDSATRTFQQATLQWYPGNGYGVLSGTETVNSYPDHSMDNNVRTELIALHFDSAVALDTVKLGWTGSDADFSVFAWQNDAITPNSSNSYMIGGRTLSNLGAAWQWVGNYANVAANVPQSVNADNYVSSWWIISAYNSNFGTGTGLENGNDYMKVLAVACKETGGGGGGSGQVPEPGSMALLGAGLFGVMALRRRRQNVI